VSDDPLYCHPGTDVLRNRFGVTDAAELERLERLHTRQRLVEGTPSGDFDLAHLQAIHRHLFQDVYEWAGDIREVEISKGGSRFLPRRFIATGMADVHRRLVEHGFLRGLEADRFAAEAARIIGDVNHVHPFREGNGRTQLEYLRQLADGAGQDFSATRLDPERWMEASRKAQVGDYQPMAQAIRAALDPERVSVDKTNR